MCVTRSWSYYLISSWCHSAIPLCTLHSIGQPSARQLTAIEWRLAGEPMAAHLWMFAGLRSMLWSQGRGYSHFFFIRRLGPSIYPSPKKNIRNFKQPKKNIWNFSNPKKYPHSVQWPQEKTLKCIEITPKYRPISWTPKKYPQNLHTKKKYIFLKTHENIEI